MDEQLQWAFLDHGIEAIELAIGAAIVAALIDVVRRRRRRRALLGFVLLELMNNHDFIGKIPDIAASKINRNTQGQPSMEAYIAGDIKTDAFSAAWASDEVRVLSSPVLAESLRSTYSGIAIVLRAEEAIIRELASSNPVAAGAILLSVANQVGPVLANIRGTIAILNVYGIKLPS